MAEGLVHDFVGSIDDAGHIAAAVDGVEGQLQAAELFDVGLQKLQRVALEEVETLTVQMQSLREREGILDGQPHVGHAQLCLHRAIDELHGRVDNRLRMDEHLDFLSWYAEKPAGLHHLEAFVHERGRVDGDFRTHVPRGVLQGVGSGDGLQLLFCELAERTARAGEQNLFYFVVALAHETLEDGRVLAVDGQDGHVVFARQLADEFAGHDECFLVGQADFLPCTNGMDGGFQT